MKNGKKIIIMGVVLIALVALYFVVTNLTKEKEEKTQKVTVSSDSSKDIVAFSYSSEDTKMETLRFSRDKDFVWHYDQDKDMPINQNLVETVVSSAAVISASRKLEGASNNMEEYGLVNPSISVSLEMKDKRIRSFHIGNYNENAQSYYLNIDGDDNIYLVDGTLKLNFSYGLYDLVQMEAFPLVETGSFVHIKLEQNAKTIEVKGTVKDDAKSYVSENSYMEKEKTWLWSVNGSQYEEGNQTAFTTLISDMSAFSFYREVNYQASKEELAMYGLDQPAAVLTVDYRVLDEKTARIEKRDDNINEVVCDTLDKQYVLYIGKQTADTNYAEDYYVRLEGSNTVYTMEKSKLSPLLEMKEKDYKK